MTDRAQFEAMLEALINEDQETAKEIFHNIVVAKSREIYEELLSEDFEPGDTGNPYAQEAFGEEEPADDEDDMDSEEDDMDSEEEPEGDIEDRVMDLEDALEDLKAESIEGYYACTIFEQVLTQPKMNFSKLSKETGIPRTSISQAYYQAIEMIKKRINTNGNTY